MLKEEPVLLLSIRFSCMVPINTQMSPFENKVEKLNLYKVVDDIKGRFGSKMVTKATVSNKKTKD